MCTEFSNCSRGYYFNTIRKPGKTCLLNIPEKKIFGTQMCGNGITEDEEECDCGMDELHRQGKICRESIAAQLAPLSCFKAVNAKGDRCGNCGGDGLTYNKCQDNLKPGIYDLYSNVVFVAVTNTSILQQCGQLELPLKGAGSLYLYNTQKA
ncbi:Disintegrin and metalloproteinase domain-containing protein 29 [Chelonia mydas]|uniref:Disintegrin and metalloproteinase domain-containing protein 29 n=1 Tax=Chelonia mydas TaxID=8469 RepID=M7ATJ2_CHEMY|nr:Disintegrin and metalloproteinase domain-containing protein 29 [Chelonia mydas]